MTDRNLSRSNDHFDRTSQRLPLGVASTCRYWGDDRTFYVSRGEGGRVWDIDDNEYVDYRLGYGPAILGYADPRVDEAAREGMTVGGVFALATELEYTVAERIEHGSCGRDGAVLEFRDRGRDGRVASFPGVHR